MKNNELRTVCAAAGYKSLPPGAKNLHAVRIALRENPEEAVEKSGMSRTAVSKLRKADKKLRERGELGSTFYGKKVTLTYDPIHHGSKKKAKSAREAFEARPTKRPKAYAGLTRNERKTGRRAA